MTEKVSLSERASRITLAFHSGVTPWSQIKKAYKKQILSAAKQGRYGCVITPYYTLHDPPTLNERIVEAEEDILIGWLESEGFTVISRMPKNTDLCPSWSVTWK